MTYLCFINFAALLELRFLLLYQVAILITHEWQ